MTREEILKLKPGPKLGEIERLGECGAARNIDLACRQLTVLLGKRGKLCPEIVYAPVNGKVGHFEWRNDGYEFMGYILED